MRFHLKSVYPLVLRDMGARIMLRKAGTYDAGRRPSTGRHGEQSDRHRPLQGRVLRTRPANSCWSASTTITSEPSRPIAIENIVVRNIPDIGTQQAELMAGGVDWMYNVPRDLAESLGATPMATHLAGPDLRVGFIVLDAAGYTDPKGP